MGRRELQRSKLNSNKIDKKTKHCKNHEKKENGQWRKIRGSTCQMNGQLEGSCDSGNYCVHKGEKTLIHIATSTQVHTRARNANVLC